MNQSTIERLAQEAGFYVDPSPRGGWPMILGPGHEPDNCVGVLTKFAALVAEECAKLCETPTGEQLNACTSDMWDSIACAEAIRAEFPKP